MKSRFFSFVILHIMLLFMAIGGVFSKFAANEEFLSARFIACYTVVLLILFVYAIGWQQIIKRLPLSTAFANKAVGVVWGIVIGFVVFEEEITPAKVIGAILVVVGIVMYCLSDTEVEYDD